MTNEVQGFRLSPQQRRLWRQGGDRTTHGTHGAIRLAGRLDADALTAALADLVRRHEILRTRFPRVAGMKTPIQSVDETSLVDYRKGELDDATEAAIMGAFEDARRRSIDREQGATLRAELLESSPSEHVLILSLPAMCADRETLGLLLAELAALYGERARGAAPASDDDEELLQYSQFAEWQNQLLEDEDAEDGKRFWRQQDLTSCFEAGLAHEREPAETDEQGPATGAPEQRLLEVPLSPDLIARVEAAASRAEVTLESFLLAAWTALLWRLMDGPRVGLGVVVSGRQYEELAMAPGQFGQTVPVTLERQPGLPFEDALARLASAVAEATEAQEYFDREDWAGADEKSPRFAFGFEAVEMPAAIEAAGLSWTLVAGASQEEPFKLALAAVHGNGVLRLELRYDARRVSEELARRMAERLKCLLADASTDPSIPIDHLEVIAAAERRDLLESFNETSRTWPEATLDQLVEARAADDPKATAVVCGDQLLTYGELDVEANRLARHLREHGVGPESVVGVWLERSPRLLIGLLGILKAGGAYLPLDPTSPPRRLESILEGSAASLVLTDSQLAPRLPQDACPLVLLDAESEEIAGCSAEPLPRLPGCDHLAYVLYTSGSTGQPKGVAVAHRSVVGYLRWASETYAAASGPAPVHSSLGFDLTVTSLFAPLVSGSAAVLLPEEAGVEALAELLFREGGFSLVKITPAHLGLLADLMPEGKSTERVGSLVIGGEELFGASLAHWRQHAPETRLINEYGPTEATVGCLIHELSPGDLPVGAIPIGRPIANVEAYVLDSRLEPVPAGVPGELYVGGEGLARGYLRSPAATAERFVPHPFTDRDSARLYRTGDRVRHLASGDLVFLDRLDRQVKIRGFRVELGEIEAALLAQPSVREAVVVERLESSGRSRLVAYAVPQQADSDLDSENLLQALAQRLPAYMVPSALVSLPALPLTANGKIDRAALPDPDTAGGREAEFEAPTTEVEKILAELWSRALGLDRVGIHDNFFRLGGDSIIGVQVIARANEAGLQLTSQQLFQHQTVAELAEVAGVAPKLVADQGPVTGPVPLTPIQHWFFEQELPDLHHFNQPVLLESREPLSPAIWAGGIGHLMEHHDALRLRFERRAEGWHQTCGPPDAAVPFTVVDLGALSKSGRWQELERAATAVQKSLDLTRGPLLRGALFQLGEAPTRLLLAVHHLVIDGVSSRILLEDLALVCSQLRSGENARLPAKTTSYRDWSAHLAERADTEQQAEETVSHWLSDARSVAASLPADFPEGDNRVVYSQTVSVSLDAQETRSLLQEVPATYNTQINDVLLTALVEAFAPQLGARSLCVDLESHGREVLGADLDVSRTVGWFTSFFPVVLDLEGVTLPGEALKTIKEQLRAVPGGGIGYGLARYLASDERLRREIRSLPSAQVIFNYLGQLDAADGGDGLFVPVAGATGPARSPRGRRSHELVINSRVVGGRLRLDWSYSVQLHRRGTVESLAKRYVEALRDLIAHCLSPEAGGFTASDFPLADLGQQELDWVMSEVEFDED